MTITRSDVNKAASWVNSELLMTRLNKVCYNILNDLFKCYIMGLVISLKIINKLKIYKYIRTNKVNLIPIIFSILKVDLM